MNSAKNVLQLCHRIESPFDIIAKSYAECFRDSDYQPVTIFITGDAEKIKHLSDDMYGESIFLGYDESAVRGFKLSVLFDLIKVCRDREFDFIIAHRYKSIYLACLLTLFSKTPLIFGVIHSANTFKRLTKKLFAMVFRKRLVLLGVSKSLECELNQHLHRFPKSRITHFYNRLDVAATENTLFSKQEARDKLGLNESEYIFATVGRLHKKKNQACMIKAFAAASPQMPNARLLLIGNGDEEAALKQLAVNENISDRVIFAGFVRDAKNYYRAFDTFVLSSRIETFGLVLLEAMVAGVPVIASRVGGIPEVVGDTGDIFDSENTSQLTQQLLQQYQLSVDEHIANGEHARARIKDCFSLEAGRRDLKNLIEVYC